MRNKNTQKQKAPKQNAVKQQPTVKARIDRFVNLEDSNIKAYASASIGNMFAIHGLRVMDSSNGLFVAMPQSCYTKDGVKQYEDLFHAITADARTELNNSVLQAYEQRIHMEEDVSEDLSEDDGGELDEDELSFEPTM